MSSTPGAKMTSHPSSSSSAASRSKGLAYVSKSSPRPNWVGLTKMEATTRSHSSRAVRIRDKCPSCSAPIVGTRPTLSPPARHCSEMARMSSGRSTVCKLRGLLPTGWSTLFSYFALGRPGTQFRLVHRPAVLRFGEGAGTYLIHEVSGRAREQRVGVGVAFDEAQWLARRQAYQVVPHEHLPVASRACPDADGRDRELPRDGHPHLDQRPDRRERSWSRSFKLHAVRPRPHQARAVHGGEVDARVAAEGKVGDDRDLRSGGTTRAPRHGRGVVDHVPYRDGQRVLVTQDDIAQRVPDEQDVHTGIAAQRGARRVVERDHGQPLPAGLRATEEPHWRSAHRHLPPGRPVVLGWRQLRIRREVSVHMCIVSNLLEWRGGASAAGGAAARPPPKHPPGGGAGVGGEVDDHPDQLARLRPASEGALVRVGVVPFGAVFDLGGERRLHDPWGNGVGAHSLRAQLGGQGAEHLHGPGLRRCIDSLSRFDDLTPDTGEGDYAPRAALGHAASELPDQAKSPLQIQLQDPVELLVRDLQHRLPDVHAWRADQDVRRADAPDRRPHAVWVRYVQLQGVGLSFVRPDLSSRRVGGLAVRVRAYDARAEGRESLRAGLSDTASGSDDEGGLA